MTKPPLGRDEAYPSEWPDILSLGPECRALDGAYANEGVVASAGGERGAILLTDILPVSGEAKANRAGVVSLRAVTRRLDSHQDAFTTLQIHAEGGERYPDESGDCYCVKGALFYSPSRWFVPILVTGGQRNVWLRRAADGSLVAKVWDYKAGIFVWPPIYRQSYVWARFTRVGG